MEYDDETAIFWWWRQRRVRKRRHTYWVHPVCDSREEEGAYHTVFNTLWMHPDKFCNYARMSPGLFTALLNLVKPAIEKLDTNYRRAIPAEEKLLVTLRYLATGNSYKSLHYEFHLGHATISKMVPEVCRAIWNALQPLYLPEPTVDTWLANTERFWQLWNFPHCLGAIDGKHVRIRCPPRAGSSFFNYKKFNSIVLQAVADADGRFTAIEVGDFGRNSDGSVFQHSDLGKAVRSGNLALPDPCPLPFETTPNHPYYFVGDEAYPLMPNLMRPYPRRDLDDPKRVFNFRLSRARKSVECAFGMMVAKWRVLEKPIAILPEKADSVVKAVCVLHNYVSANEGMLADDAAHVPGNTTTSTSDGAGGDISRTRPSVRALAIRSDLCRYFLRSHGALSWQYAAIGGGRGDSAELCE